MSAGDGESPSRAFHSAVTTLTLGILGSSVLPIPYCFSRLGVFPGLVVALIVALANAYTGTILIRAAGHLKKTTYEGTVAGAFRNKAGIRTLAQLALIFLLFGTLAGDAALLADTGTLTLEDLTRGHVPEWLGGSGRVPMLALVLFLVLPLSLSPQMRSLEKAAIAGIFLLFILTAVIIKETISAGFPAIVTGELPLIKFAPGAEEQLPEAMSVLFFAFYLQPMLLPLLSEMPEGKRGQDLLCSALNMTTLVIAFFAYGIVGVFGAARWGLKTEGDVLVNRWLPGRASGALDAAMAIYLSISMAPMAITMRYLLDSIVVGKGELVSYSRSRDTWFTIGGILSATSVAAIWPEQAEKLFAVTGCTGVLLVSYVLPVLVHFKLYWTRRRPDVVSTDQEAWLLEDASLLEASSNLDTLDCGGIGIGGGIGGMRGRRDSSVAVVAGGDIILGAEVEDVEPGDDTTSGGGGVASTSTSRDTHQHAIDSEIRSILRQPLLLRPAANVVERPGGYPHIRQLGKLPYWKQPFVLCWHVVVPLLVLLLGLGTSFSALALSLKKF
jgi:solute carrier family 38 (sodium-coupled neutral amino acid transporter), member 11